MSERAGGARRVFAGHGGRLKRMDGGPPPTVAFGAGARRKRTRPPGDDTAGRRRGGGAAAARRRRGERLFLGRSPPGALIRCRHSSSAVARPSPPAPRRFRHRRALRFAPEGAGRGTTAPTRMPSRLRYGPRNRGRRSAPGQLMGRVTDLTRRLPYPLSCIAPPSARAPPEFSEKARSSWRRGTGGESRRPCIAGTASPRISLPHIDFLPSSRSQERPRNNHPSPRLSGTPGGARGPRFSRGPVRRFLETVRFGFPSTGGAARLRRMPVATGRARWVIRRTRCYALPLDAGPGGAWLNRAVP